MISVLLPSRGRPGILERMVVSIHETAKGRWDCVVYADEDDTPTIKLCEAHADAIKLVVGPRIILTDCWNKCLPLAGGDLLMQGNDDVIFRTPGWDLMAEGAFAQCPDKVLMVYGDDKGMHFGNFGPHPIVHRRWLEVTGGWFIPPYFWSEFGDTWINEVFKGIDRARFLPFVVEHMHYEFKKSEFDQTYRDRVENHKRTNPGHHYEFMKPERLAQIERLRALLGTEWRPSGAPSHL